MARYITVDGGTTNTRLSLVCDGKISASKRFNIGARAGIDDHLSYRNAIKQGIDELLYEAKLTEADITRVLASGMITSEFGLVRLDHLTAPVGIRELHDSMHEQIFSDICSIPFVFVRGVKTDCTALDLADMMRGEETELYGLGCDGEGAYILPGSHSKIIYTDKNGRIDRFYTMLTGEMISALSSGTILKDAVDLSVRETDNDYLIRGCKHAMENGLNEALFKVRILKNLFGATKEQTYSFFLGAILSGEISKILKLAPKRITVGGKEQLKLAMCAILSEMSDSEIIAISASDVDTSVSRGVIKIYEYK